MKNLRNALWSLVAVCVFVLAFLYFNPGQDKHAHHHGEHDEAQMSFGAPFKLPSAKGGEFDSASLAGKPYGIFLGFTNCADVCPTTLSELTIALSELGDKAADFKLIFITTDPERDTAAKMKDYVASFDARIEPLVPSPEQLMQLAKDFHFFYKKVPNNSGGYDMDHTATVFLFDREGGLKSTLSVEEGKAVRLEKLEKVMR